LGVVMVLVYEEPASMRVRGTIIDLETVGEFDGCYPPWDLRHYAGVRPTIFGYITEDGLVQYCAEGEEDLREIGEIMGSTLPFLKGPFYALNTSFERCIIENMCGLQPFFYDVRGDIRGSKWGIRQDLGLPTYDDPFHGDGSRCMSEWRQGNYGDCMKHNRACLLIERDIHEYSLGLTE